MDNPISQSSVAIHITYVVVTNKIGIKNSMKYEGRYRLVLDVCCVFLYLTVREC
jgi:hypothetical protein